MEIIKRERDVRYIELSYHRFPTQLRLHLCSFLVLPPVIFHFFTRSASESYVSNSFVIYTKTYSEIKQN